MKKIEIVKNMKNIKYWFKQIIQKITKGYSDNEICILNHHLCKFILPRLKAFRNTYTYPPCFMTCEEWKEKIDKMIVAFELIIDDNMPELVSEQLKRQQKITEGLQLFARYFQHLWY
jgi:hypothetical protein